MFLKTISSKLAKITFDFSECGKNRSKKNCVGGEVMARKEDDEVKITHHFADGSVSDTLEGHVIPDDIQIEIFKILLAGKERRRENRTK